MEKHNAAGVGGIPFKVEKLKANEYDKVGLFFIYTHTLDINTTIFLARRWERGNWVNYTMIKNPYKNGPFFFEREGIGMKEHFSDRRARYDYILYTIETGDYDYFLNL